MPDFSGNLSVASSASLPILPVARLPMTSTIGRLEGIAGLATWGRVEWLENSPLCQRGNCALIRPEHNRCAGGGIGVWYYPSINECQEVWVRLLSSEPCGSDGGTACGLRGEDVRFSTVVYPTGAMTRVVDGASLALPSEPIAGPDDLGWASPWQGLSRVCHDSYEETRWRRSEIGLAPGCECAGGPPTGSYALLVDAF